MKIPPFKNVVLSIKDEQWEKALPIGKFKYIQIDKIIQRPFSIISKCLIFGRSCNKTVYVKMYTRYFDADHDSLVKKVENDFKIATWWYGLFSETEEFNVVKPIMVIPEKCIIVTEEGKGKNLHQIIRKTTHIFSNPSNYETTVGYLRNVGKWLKYRNEILYDDKSIFSIEGLKEYINLRLKILTTSTRRKFPKLYRNKVNEYLCINVNNVKDYEYIEVVSHNDFNLGNVLVVNDKVTVLDFGKSRKDSFLLDVSKIYYHIHLYQYKPQYSINAIRRMQSSLLEGFGNKNADKLMMFRFMLIRNTITHLVNITKFWEQNLKEKLYNMWVLYKEQKNLNKLINL